MKLYCTLPSTYSQKVLIAADEKNVKLQRETVNLMDPQEREKYRKIYPIGKVPLLVLDNDYKIPESSIIIEYLDTHFESGPTLIPTDKELGRKVRFFDRMSDLYLNNSIGTIIFESWKPESEQNKEEVEKCKYYLDTMYMFLDKELKGKTWMAGNDFTMADCAAAGPLFYAKQYYPFEKCSNTMSYFGRLMERASIKTLMDEVMPVLQKIQEKMKR